MPKINFKNKKTLLIIIRDLFLVAFVLLIVFSFMELLKPRIITNYLNLDIYLLILLLLGIISISFYSQEKKEISRLKLLDYSTIILFSILVGILIFYLIREIGVLSMLVGIISAIICYLFIILNYKK